MTREMTRVDVDRPGSLPLPHLQGLTALRGLIHYSRQPLAFSALARDKYGDAVRLQLGPVDLYLFNHPSLIEAVLSQQNQHFVKDLSYRALRGAFGDGLLLSEGDLWRRHRRLMQPGFTGDRMASYAEVIVADTAQVLSTWRAGEVRDIHREMSQLTVRVITRAMFGVDAVKTALEIVEAMDAIMVHYFHQLETWFLVPDWWPSPHSRKAYQATQRLKAIAANIVAERQQSPKDDLLSGLLQAQGEDGSALSSQELEDEVMTLLLAGHETTATTLTWTLLLLAQHPVVWDKLAEEVQSVLSDRPPTYADLPRLRYTEQVLKESMRLYPPAWALGREVIQNCQVGDYVLKRGALVYVSQWAMHRDPRFFDAPEQFCPERWQDNLEQRLPRGVYFPFGAGPRVCIGKAFSVMESVLILAMVAQRFRLTLAPQPPAELLPSITLRPKSGIEMEIGSF